MTTQLAKLVEGGAALEVAMNSVERIKHYHDSIKPEVTVNAREVPKDWPTRGEVRLNNLCVRYRDKPLVLKGVSAVIDAGTRVGICGRTGSGKSTLLTSMFRINNPAEGSIEIDGLDIARVPLPILRSRLAVIPQVCGCAVHAATWKAEASHTGVLRCSRTLCCSLATCVPT